MAKANVKWFDAKKGYGFAVNEEGKDVFIHYSCIEGDGFKSLKDGQAVEFEQVKSDKGFSAKNVRIV